MRQGLEPSGLAILNEYIGPNRFQFSPRQKELINSALLLLPARYRTLVREQVELELERTPSKVGVRWLASRFVSKVREGDLLGVIKRRFIAYRARRSGEMPVKEFVDFPSVSSVISADPSEAVRSAEIVEVLQQEFEIVERKDWGGNILQFLLSGIAGNFAEVDPCSQQLLDMLIKIEDTLLECGELESDFAFIVARPRAG
jgi:hypothetical protein